MVELVCVGKGFIFQVCDSYAVIADNVEEAKSELFDKIEKEVDRYVNNKLSSIVSDDIIRIEVEDDGK